MLPLVVQRPLPAARKVVQLDLEIFLVLRLHNEWGDRVIRGRRLEVLL